MLFLNAQTAALSAESSAVRSAHKAQQCMCDTACAIMSEHLAQQSAAAHPPYVLYRF